MLLSDFDFDLPAELIAQRPADRRDESRLLVLERKKLSFSHCSFKDLPCFLPAGSLLVLNDTRVFPARLRGWRESGGKVEVLLLHRKPGTEEVWEVMVRASSRPKPREKVIFAPELWGQWEKEGDGGRPCLRLFPKGELFSILEKVGEVPLPPYIKRSPQPEDRDRYQTVYARATGSVAAPTAGLHFTAELLGLLQERGVEVLFLTLHVGPGTFQPLRTETIEEHRMEGEEYELGVEVADRINQAKAQGQKVIAVGTTTTRALESAAVEKGQVCPGKGKTELFIHPGYTFKVIDGLLTNFHLPRSTPLLLVSALTGRELLLKAYGEAIRLHYRFYSYGDAMLIL